MSHSNIFHIVAVAAVIAAGAEAHGQTAGMNYVRVTEPKTPSASDPSTSGGAAKVTVTYFDGLGREIESVAVASSPDGNDIATHTEYNYRNLPVRKFLPVESENGDGSFVTRGDIIRLGEEQYGDSRPFSETLYEDDQTRRPVGEYKPGDDLAGRHVSLSYSFNQASGMYACTLFKLNGDTLENRGVYPENRLKVTCSANEDGHETYVFTDKRGRTVLERRVMSNQLPADTYFIYDIYGDLRYMLSPEGASKVTSPGRCDTGILDRYCYRYRYDSRHRMIERKLPGCEPEYFVYDKAGHLVYSQNGDERRQGVWHAIKYDAKGRKALEGTTAMGASKMGEAGRVWLQAQLLDRKFVVTAEPEKDYDMQLFYAHQDDSYGTFTRQIAYFYDNYSHWNRQEWNDELPFNLPGYPADSCLLDATGLPTGKAMVSGGQVWITATVYDRFANPIVECAQEYHEGYTFYTVTNRDFRGMPTQTKSKMYYFDSKSTPPVSGETLYAYDNGDRLAFVSHRYGDKAYWRVIKVNGYDRLGRLITERIPDAAGGHTTEFSYNPRGQVTGLSGSLFRQALHYTDNPFDGPVSFSGNLSATEVSSLNIANGSPTLAMRKISYTYDALDRITEAADCSGDTGGYTPFEERYRYDRNGNVVSFSRDYGGQHWDIVQLIYNGNQIMRVTSAIKDADYLGKLPKMPFYHGSIPLDPVRYDAVGRLIRDDTRGIDTLRYVYGLAQPLEVKFANKNRMINIFRADGTKISERITLRYLNTVETAGTEAAGGESYKFHDFSRYFYGPIVGEHETGSTMRYRIYNDAGYVLYDPKTGVGEYRFYIRDHLGNVRVETDSDGNVVRAVDYTASGIPVERRSLADPGPECFGGLAYYDELGNGWYDNNARVMESLLMRFTAMDPLCEKYPSISPYANSLCNPLRFSDPTGLEVNYDNLTDEQKRKVNATHENVMFSDVFKQIYNFLNDKENTTVYLAFGTTSQRADGSHVPGQYDPETNTITFYDGNDNVGTATYAEEFVHAYQDAKGILTDPNYNAEYEAKLIVTSMAGEGGVFGSIEMFGGKSKSLTQFLNEIRDYGIQLNAEFMQRYRTEGAEFINYHTSIKSNSNYLRPINSPSSLFLNLYNK